MFQNIKFIFKKKIRNLVSENIFRNLLLLKGYFWNLKRKYWVKVTNDGVCCKFLSNKQVL